MQSDFLITNEFCRLGLGRNLSVVENIADKTGQSLPDKTSLHIDGVISTVYYAQSKKARENKEQQILILQ